MIFVKQILSGNCSIYITNIQEIQILHSIFIPTRTHVALPVCASMQENMTPQDSFLLCDRFGISLISVQNETIL